MQKHTLYGDLPVSPERLAEELDKLANRNDERPGTLGLMRYLDQLGQEVTSRKIETKVETEEGLKDFASYFNDRENKRRAFLLDFLWWQEGLGTLLAVESEISDPSIKGLQHDFEKLLCWKSPMKLMITTEHPGRSAEVIAHELSVYARNCCSQYVPNETYLLFVYGEPRNHAYVFVAGEGRGFEFRKIGLAGTQVA
jgi:hypothetical protein